jgi:hypothetical protein
MIEKITPLIGLGITVGILKDTIKKSRGKRKKHSRWVSL